MMRKIVIGVLGAFSLNAEALSQYTVPLAANGEFQRVYTSDGTYLGCWGCADNTIDSLNNVNSLFRERLKTEMRTFSSRTSSQSMCALSSTNPPYVELKLGSSPNARIVFALSRNSGLPNSVCNPFGSYYSRENCNRLENFCDRI